jgi:hypothetical protein
MTKSDFLSLSHFDALKYAWKMYDRGKWTKEQYLKALEYHRLKQVKSEIEKDVEEVFGKPHI